VGKKFNSLLMMFAHLRPKFAARSYIETHWPQEKGCWCSWCSKYHHRKARMPLSGCLWDRRQNDSSDSWDSYHDFIILRAQKGQSFILQKINRHWKVQGRVFLGLIIIAWSVRAMPRPLLSSFAVVFWPLSIISQLSSRSLIEFPINCDVLCPCEATAARGGLPLLYST